ncbi:hypothetical protein GDO86_012665 [Hymenochirus boettgeri]|uniref:Taste receptor type 1 member 2 n=1 Tax=Hymenochirus boettgeri TaxID=247094 RepID=A0A8T2ITN3_9PIPI|nr:hypothetical protein GDO86_012665 [Hymenochirus boettgeri]
MKFALEEISNSTTLLPNISLGYEVFDTCYIYNNIHPALEFISKDRVFDTNINLTSYVPKVISVVGPDSSDAAETTAGIFSLLLIPQINFLATSRKLSVQRLPSFFQTIPSSHLQQQAIVDILYFFNWTWIVTLGSADDYGYLGVQQLTDSLSEVNICVAYQGMIPIKIKGKEDEWEKKILSIINNILQTKANVIVLYSLDMIALDFFSVVVNSNLLHKIWVATETWSMTEDIYNIPHINSIGTVFGIALKYVMIPDLEEYLLKTQHDNTDRLNELDLEKNCNQECQGCQTAASNETSFSEKSVSFSIYAAIYAIAHALHMALNCDDAKCEKTEVYPWQVVQFDENGSMPTGYDIVYWDWRGERPFKRVGSYGERRNFVINVSEINWQSTDSQIPSSVCSQECLPGQEKKHKGMYKCCFTCVNCGAGTYLNSNGSCAACSNDQWSDEGSTCCFDKTRKLLIWKDKISIILLVVTSLGTLLTVLAIVIFAVHLESPVVKAAGGKMCFLMLVSLSVAYLCTIAYIGEPCTLKCILRLPVFNIALAICFSYISFKSFQIVCIFKMASKLPASFDYWVKQNGQYICVAILTAIQVLISIVWIITSPPTISIKNLGTTQILVDCSQFGSVYSILQYGYNAFLSLLCFTFAYMGKELPKNYSEAKCITFAMFIYIVVCISVFTAQLIDIGEYVTPINDALSLASLYGITGGYFFPKCYIILCRPQLNTTKYFQSAIHSYTKR